MDKIKEQSEHNTSHPTADNTVAFSRGRKIQKENYENGDQGTIIMEMQSDVHRNKPAKLNYPTSSNDFTSSKKKFLSLCWRSSILGKSK